MKYVRPLLAALAVMLAAPSARAQESLLEGAKGAAKSGDPRAIVAYGRALRRAGHDDAAMQELRRAAAVAPTGPVGIEARWEIARTWLAKRQFQPAMATCRAIVAMPGGATAGHACAAEAHLFWKRGSEALLETAQALANGTKSYEAKVAEGIANELALDDDAAERSFREAIAWRPDAWEAHMYLGRLLVRRLRHDEGVAELRAAARLDPSGPDEAFELARTMPPGAESAALLEKAVRERPGFAAAWRRLAEVYLATNRMADARRAAEAAVKSDATDAASHVIVGRVALAEGDADAAIKEGQAALAIVANSAHAKLLIADAYAKKHEIDFAVENYQAAFGLDHSDPAPLVHASEACHAEGRDTSAKAFGERATRDFPDFAPGWVALGDALVANKETNAAKTAYQTALGAHGPIDAAAVRAKLAALK